MPMGHLFTFFLILEIEVVYFLLFKVFIINYDGIYDKKASITWLLHVSTYDIVLVTYTVFFYHRQTSCL